MILLLNKILFIFNFFQVHSAYNTQKSKISCVAFMSLFLMCMACVYVCIMCRAIAAPTTKIARDEDSILFFLYVRTTKKKIKYVFDDMRIGVRKAHYYQNAWYLYAKII